MLYKILEIAIYNGFLLAVAAVVIFISLILFRESTIIDTDRNFNLKNLLFAIIIAIVASNIIVWTSYHFQKYPIIYISVGVLTMILAHYSFYYFVNKLSK